MSPSSPTRTAILHTPESAARALPLLRAIAQDVHACYLRVRGRLRALDERRSLDELRSDSALPEDVRDELAELHDLMRELTELGGRLADPELGLVLLDAEVQGRAGSLCWKIGEDAIRHWFPLGERYENRRPLPAAEAEIVDAPASRSG